jgi:hypothetical protein
LVTARRLLKRNIELGRLGDRPQASGYIDDFEWTRLLEHLARMISFFVSAAIQEVI